MEQKDEKGIIVGLKMSNLQVAIQILIDVFHSYSKKEGDKYKLNNAEMKNLLQGELKDFIACGRNPEEVQGIMVGLDENKDGEVDFQEFVIMIAGIAIVCNEFFEDFDRSRVTQQSQQHN